MDCGRVWYQSYYDDLIPDFLITDEQQLITGELRFFARHLPGHAPGHIAFFSNDFILSGDVLLNHISSNAILTFEHDTPRRVRALCQQRDSLAIMERQTAAVYPGHGPIIKKPATVARKHLDAQESRYNQIIDALKKGEASLFEVAKRVFPQTDQPRMTFLCLSEVIGYLDLSIDRKDVDFDDDKNVFYLKK
jgi:glyoxylase-like metal-dependent hydrolase (beta-lactamase superfamily II)